MKQLSIEDWQTIFRCISILKGYDMYYNPEEIKVKWAEWCENFINVSVRPIALPQIITSDT